MAIEGNLNDLSLASLVQTLCLEQSTSSLVLRRRLMEEGAVYFDGGEIVHASAGVLTGEDALYHLLSWTEGTFRQNDFQSVPPRTVKAPWNRLLLEGMKRVDHQETAAAALAELEGGLKPADVERDGELENGLLLLLSRLEQDRVRLNTKRAREHAALALQTLTEMINQTAAFCEEIIGAEAGADYMTRALAWAGDARPAARLLQASDNRLSAQTVSKLHGSMGNDPAGRRQVFHEMGLAMLDMLETLLIRLSASLRSPAAAIRWRDTCCLFLTDLGRAVGQIQF